MSKKILGVEIGSFRMKLADCTDADNGKIHVVDVPDNLVQGNKIVSWDAMAEFIKETVRANKIMAKDVAISIPKDQVFTKRVTMPAMTRDQLKINLPFEFHDYITEDKDKYVYDYAVIDKPVDSEGKIIEMELLAVAAEKQLIENYKVMFRRGGLKLCVIAPEFSALRNIIREHDDSLEISGQGDYAVVDLGHNSVEMHFFDKGEYEITRVMETGMKEIDEYIAESMDVDRHIANMYKESNKEGILESDGCIEIYNRIAVEAMRVINFYDFNHPDNNIDKIYCCGGGAMVPGILRAIASNTGMEAAKINELFETEYGDEYFVLEGALALGITQE
ncbi:MAG: pilus assembly protein PilM [Clostridiales bacterium]|nr:pilus assembly protein PilM [Clostridiales bacterium]